jgi:hypothetical protein
MKGGVWAKFKSVDAVTPPGLTSRQVERIIQTMFLRLVNLMRRFRLELFLTGSGEGSFCALAGDQGMRLLAITMTSLRSVDSGRGRIT